ncbi:hypothetical protein N6147_001755 [Proteus mirabilis]
MGKIDKYLLQELSLLRDEKGELARWVLQFRQIWTQRAVKKPQ